MWQRDEYFGTHYGKTFNEINLTVSWLGYTLRRTYFFVSPKMKEKIKQFFREKCGKLAEPTKNAILTCFNAIGPVWTFFFLKTQDPDLKDSNETS